MEHKDKDLLLKDICSRLPYGAKIYLEDFPNATLVGVVNDGIILHCDKYDYTYDTPWDIEYIKPYLFPLSSMTEKQKEELLYNYIHNDIYFDDFTDYFLAGELWHDICVSIDALPELINWLNKNHFDYRGLIKKRLAIDCTNLNIY